jgi:hypothetical protein
VRTYFGVLIGKIGIYPGRLEGRLAKEAVPKIPVF